MKSHIRTLVVSALLLITSQAHAVYGVQDAINDALSDNLKYIGSFVPRYSEDGKMKMCLYRGTKVLVYMYYCSKKSFAAVSLRIHSIDPQKGSLAIYAETAKGGDITSADRAQYSDYGFSVSTFDNGTFIFNGAIKDFRTYDDALSKSPSTACLSSRVFRKHCAPTHQNQVGPWTDGADDFWNKPTSNWYQLVKAMKAKVP